MAIFRQERYDKWVEDTHIPREVMDMVNFVADKIGHYHLEEEVIGIKNRGGYTVGYGKGFTLSHCTSSYANGPGVDYAPYFLKWLKGLGFELENSYGDNGMDSASNWHDTYWYKELIYKPSIVYDDFYEYDDDDY